MSAKEKSPAMRDLMQRHPMQRLSSPSRSISALVHVLGLASFAYSFHYLSAHPNHINQSFGSHGQYLTIVGLALATATFILGLLSDITLNPRIFALKNVLSCASAPLETLITTLYWGLRAIDPELVVPKELELPLPPDLSFHAVPTVVLLVDFLLLSPPWQISAVPALALSSGIAFSYWFWIELCYARNGFYPYPLFEILDTKQRVGLFTVSAVLMTGSTLAIKWLYRKVNGVEPRGMKMGTKKTS